MTRLKRTRAEWTKVIARYHASGQSAEVFAEKHGLIASTLRWWSSEFRRTSRDGKTSRIGVREVLVAAPTRTDATFEIGVGSVVMRFEVGTDPRYVAALVASLTFETAA